MKPEENEALARILINDKIKNSGWYLNPLDNNGKINVKVEDRKVRILDQQKEITITDYTFLDENDHPMMLLEAKSGIYDPLIAKAQAKQYAESRKINLIILSNGYKYYFWDLRKGNPEQIDEIPKYEKLIDRIKDFSPKINNFINEKIDENYIASTQFPKFSKNSEYLNKDRKEDFIKNNQLRFLRPYQIEAINNLIKDFKKGKSKFLFTMATGTGKTLLSAAICKLFLRNSIAKRVLFLVDRIELEKQAEEAFSSYFKKEYEIQVFKNKKKNWNDAKILISTSQSLTFNEKYKKIFDPMDFDLIIVDEAHRSIINSSKDLIDYFPCYKIGLTATPKNYFKNLEIIDDPKEYEYRALRDTFRIFGCEEGMPTFNYSLEQGLEEGYLVNHYVIDARSPNVTSKLLSEEGLVKVIKKKDGTSETVIYRMKDYRKKYINDETDKEFVKTFFKEAKKDPITGEIGKTIFFCVSQAHCREITKLLNLYADKFFPNKYNSNFAEQVSSEIGKYSQSMSSNFANNILNGKSDFNKNVQYNTSKTRCCVTVAMMTTGYDCEDLLNICFLKPIVSPSDFIQYKGRGTRRHNFNENFILDQDKKNNVKKENFYIFDYFGVFEYFENKYPYDKKINIRLPRETKGTPVGGGVGEKYKENIENPMSEIKIKDYQNTVTKADKKNLELFEKFVRSNEAIVEAAENDHWDEIESFIEENYFKKNNMTLKDLSSHLQLGRTPTTRELIEKALGFISKFKSKNELIDDHYRKFVSEFNFNKDEYWKIKNFFEVYSTDDDFREIIRNKKISELAASNKFNISDYRDIENMIPNIVNYCDSNVSIN